MLSAHIKEEFYERKPWNIHFVTILFCISTQPIDLVIFGSLRIGRW